MKKNNATSSVERLKQTESIKSNRPSRETRIGGKLWSASVDRSISWITETAEKSEQRIKLLDVSQKPKNKN